MIKTQEDGKKSNDNIWKEVQLARKTRSRQINYIYIYPGITVPLGLLLLEAVDELPNESNQHNPSTTSCMGVL